MSCAEGRHDGTLASACTGAKAVSGTAQVDTTGSDMALTRIDAAQARLRILATSDLHHYLLPWDYFTDSKAPMRGLSLTAGLIARARAEVPDCLLVDNGDFLQGSAMADLLANTVWKPPDGRQPMIAAMNQLGYAVAALGNHEFSFGQPFLKAAMAQAAFPMISANIAHRLGAAPQDDALFAAPTALISHQITDSAGRRHRLEIGFVGLTPPQTVGWDSEVLQGQLQAREMTSAAAFWQSKLRKDGADLVIALAHSGPGDVTEPLGGENNLIRLARDLGFDALVGGHVHSRFPDPAMPPSPGLDPKRGLIHGRPVVMPGFFGSHLGVIDLSLTQKPGGGWLVSTARAELRAVSHRTAAGNHRRLATPDPAVERLAREAHDQTRRWSRRQIGVTERAIHSHFALVAPCTSVRLVAMAQREHTISTLRGTLWDGLPVLSAAAPFRSGGRGGPGNFTEIAPGPITLRNIADLYEYPNTLIALHLSGAEIAEWLERSASAFHQIVPGSHNGELLNADNPPFDFDCIEGVSYAFDLSQPARFDGAGRLLDAKASRIRHLARDGRPVRPDDRFVLVTNSYRIGGGGGFAPARPDKVILRNGQSSRNVVADWVSRFERLPIPDVPNWRFVPMPGTSVRFRTSPHARTDAPEMSGLRIESEELDAEGFRAFRLFL